MKEITDLALLLVADGVAVAGEGSKEAGDLETGGQIFDLAARIDEVAVVMKGHPSTKVLLQTTISCHRTLLVAVGKRIAVMPLGRQSVPRSRKDVDTMPHTDRN